MDDVSGIVIKGYELKERIGSGGFSTVYRAYQLSVGRDVALKIILPDLANHPEFIRRFDTEAQIAVRLEHPHIAPVYDYWRDPSGAYLVMRWLRGGNLRESLQSRRYDLPSTVHLLEQIASGLTLAHRNSFIHRDIKPANILLDEDGNSYLADFGIAKDLNFDAGASQADAITGSLDYISPEQARGEPITPRTDLYSLGVTLYEIITGQHPFPNNSSIERLYKHINDPLPPITSLPPARAARINAVIQQATAKDPRHRHIDALTLAAEFRAAAGINVSADDQTDEQLLTLREHEILQLIIDGMANKEIAHQLTVNIGTIKWYINQIYRKLGVRNRVQAIIRARELDLIALSANKTAAEIDSTVDFKTILENPYKGLRAFQVTDEQDFFGREETVQRLVRRLGETQTWSRFLAVIGPSGSGKSSLVRAGLIPALWRGDLPGSQRWFVAEMLPGTDPLEKLEVALIRVASRHAVKLNEQLKRDERGLLRVIDLILPEQPRELVLIIDQFEEVFTLVTDEAARLHFLKLLIAAVKDPHSRVRIIITLRADFYDRPLRYVEFGELLRSRMETILPLSPHGLERATTGPAERVGVTFEAGLVTQIVAEMNYQAGALPLLQFALTELFERRNGRLLTHQAYQEMGRAIGALARRADELYIALPATGQDIARQIFLRLLTLGEGTEDTRRRVSRSELLSLSTDTDLIEEILDTFASFRLLTLDHDPISRTPTVEWAHEAILQEWTRLRGWISEARSEIRIQRQLTALAAEWHHTNQDPSFLLRGARLEQYEKWMHERQLALTGTEQAYLEAGLAERSRAVSVDRERQVHIATLERRSRNVLLSLVVVLLIATSGALALTAFAFGERSNAQNNARLATSRVLAAAAVTNLSSDTQRSLLLAVRAVRETYNHDGTWTLEAEEALHRAAGMTRAQRSLLGHEGAVTDVAFSPDGTRVATASVDGTAIIWDVAKGSEVFTLRQLEGQAALAETVELPDVVNLDVYSVSYNSEGTLLVTSSGDGSAVVWDALTGQSRFILRPPSPTLPVIKAIFSPDGTQIALLATDVHLGGSQWEIVVWTLKAREIIFSYAPSATLRGGIFGDTWGDIAFSPDGQRLALTTSEDVELWDLASTRKLLTLIGNTTFVSALTFSPDGTRLASVGDDNVVRVWALPMSLDFGLATTLEVLTLEGRHEVVYSPDGSRLAAASESGVVNVWDSLSGTLLFNLTGYSSSARGIAFSPDGSLIATSSHDHATHIWDAGPGAELFTLNTPAVGEFGFSPDGTRLATGGGFSEFSIWDITTGGRLLSVDFEGDGATSVTFSPDGSQIAASGDVAARIFDANSGQLLVTLVGHTSLIDELKFSPDGTRLVTASNDGTAKMWDVATGAELITLSGVHTSGVHCVAFSPDGKFLATGGDDRKVVIWDLATLEPTLILPTQGSTITSIVYSPDGSQITTSSLTDSAYVWDTATGDRRLDLSGHPSGIWDTRFSPDGKLLVTTGGTVAKVRDAGTGEVLFTLYGHTDGLWDSAFSPDGTRIATAAADQTVRVYVLPMEELLTLAESRLTRSWTEEECRQYLHVERCPADLERDRS